MKLSHRHSTGRPIRPGTIVESCNDCPLRRESFFCWLSSESFSTWADATIPSFHQPEATLFIEGQRSRGVYQICYGRVKLTRTDHERTLIVRIAEAGEILGVGDAFTDGTHRYTATALDPSLVRFMEARAFLRFFQAYKDVCKLVAQQFVREIDVSERLRFVSAQPTAPSRLAHLLLYLAESKGKRLDRGFRITPFLRHKELGQILACSRETITRILGRMKDQGLIEIAGASILILDTEALLNWK